MNCLTSPSVESGAGAGGGARVGAGELLPTVDSEGPRFAPASSSALPMGGGLRRGLRQGREPDAIARDKGS